MSDAGGGGEWVLIGLDEKLARQQGVPFKVPVPKAEFDALADKGMTIDQIRKWVAAFMTTAGASNSKFRSENAPLVKSFETFIAKADGWNKAQAAFAKGDMKAAIGALRLVSNLDPNDHAAKLNLGSALANSGDHAGARKHFEGITETYRDDADFHVAYGNVLLAMQDRDKAVGEFVLALEANPECHAALECLKGLGVLVALYENPKDAASLTYVRADSVLDYIKSVWDAEPRDAAYFREQIAYHEMEKRSDVVLAAVERAIATGASDERIVAAKIAALRSQGKNDEAIELARKQVADNDASAAAHVDLGRCLIAAGKGDEALAEVNRALALDPGDLMAIDLRFWPADRHDLQQVASIVPELQKHADAHPESAGALRSLARAKLVTGNSDEAFTIFAKAVAMAPGDDELRAEYWGELGRLRKFDEVIADANKIEGGLAKRDWKLRWNEAEAYAGLGKKMEAQTIFAAINHDESLHVDLRKRAKRAATAQAGG